MPETRVTRLSNGFTVASETNPNFQTATVGVWIDAGSRFENERNNGTAHFLEHMAFKGTRSRTQLALETQIENMGGHLNAYTSREQTVYYAKCLSHDLGTSVDILSDILQRSNYDRSAIERERDVILRESEEVDKQKEEVVFDHLHAAAFSDSPLGRTILGPPANIKSISREDLVNYVKTNYTPDRMVLAAAGGVDHAQLVKLAEEQFGHLGKVDPSATASALGPKPVFHGIDHRTRIDDHPTAHVALAVEGVSWTSPDYWPLLVAQSIVGSWDRSLGAGPSPDGESSSARLSHTIYRYNLANSFMSFNTSYSDTGLFGMYAVSENPSALPDLITAIQREWARLSSSVTPAEVARAKNQLRTSLLLSLDGTTPVTEDIGRQMLVYGRRMTPAEVDDLIGGVTREHVMDVMRRYMSDKDVCCVAYGPIAELGPFQKIRDGMVF